MLAERRERWMREREQRGLRQDREEDQRRERLRIARSLLDVIADDRLLAERIGLSEAEVRGLRAAAGCTHPVGNALHSLSLNIYKLCF